VGPGQISDDDHPFIGGVGPHVEAGPWLDKQGAAKDAVYTWVGARLGKTLTPASAEAALGELWCRSAKVGDPSVEALVCPIAPLRGLMPIRAVGLVVRNKKPAIVFDVGIRLGAMAFPDAHHLELSLVLAADGKSFDLKERAPDGTILVEAPSACREREETNAPSMRFSPSPLHDCAGSKALLTEMARDVAKDPTAMADLKNATAFVNKTCQTELGHYTWQKDRFAK
jgi:hypothetical protein